VLVARIDQKAQAKSTAEEAKLQLLQLHGRTHAHQSHIQPQSLHSFVICHLLQAEAGPCTAAAVLKQFSAYKEDRSRSFI